MTSKNSLISHAEQILATLVSFQSVPGSDGTPILDWVTAYLQGHGLQVHRFPFPPSKPDTEAPANIFTTIGPLCDGGICLSAHLDVVPAAGHNWTRPPFELTVEEELRRFYGRGTTDMKGFAALILAMVPEWVQQQHRRPLHLAFTYDEESGCRGAPYLIEQIGRRLPRPDAVIVGEPTGMVPVIGHKGGTSCYTEIHGIPAHSSNPSKGVSAIYIANDIINFLRNTADAMRRGENQDYRFDPSHSTLSVGTVHGGTSRNIIPEECRIVWEIRSIPGESADSILKQLERFIKREVLARYQPRFPVVDVRTTLTAKYPPLIPEHDSTAIQFVRGAGCDTAPKCVTFGTEAGHYQSAGIPAVVWGPGDIAQAHIIDEYIDVQALSAFLDHLIRL